MRRSVLRVVRRTKVMRVMSTKLLGVSGCVVCSCIGSPVVIVCGIVGRELSLVATILWLLLSG